MGAAIGDVLGLAAGVAVSPLPIVASILMLVTAKGRANGLMFAAGWLVGLAVLGTVVLMVGALLSAANPKNGGLTIAAVASIARGRAGRRRAGGQNPGCLECLGRRA